MNQTMENELIRLAMSCKARLNVAFCSSFAEIMFGDVAHGDKLVIVFFNLLAQGGDVLLDFFYTTIPPRLGKDFFLFRSVCVRSVLLLTRPAFYVLLDYRCPSRASFLSVCLLLFSYLVRFFKAALCWRCPCCFIPFDIIKIYNEYIINKLSYNFFLIFFLLVDFAGYNFLLCLCEY